MRYDGKKADFEVNGLKVELDLSTRKVLLTMLKTSGALSVGEMAKRLRITEMAVRRHLNTLERDDLVTTSLVRQAMGRPSHLYSLTEHAEHLFPKNYHSLALDLLEELESESDENLVEKLFERRKNKLFRRYGERMKSADLQGKVAELANIQNENGYMAGWERDEQAGGFIINEFNCPISQVANQYGHACQSELELFRELLGADVERVECLAKDGRKCRYVIREQAE